MHREIAQDVAAARAGLLHAFALKGDRRVLRHIKEICAPQIFVPLVVPGVDARGIDRCVDGRFFRMIGIDTDRALELLEAAVHITEEVPHLEIDRRVDRIDLISVVGAGRHDATTEDGGNKEKKVAFHGPMTLTNGWPLARSFVAGKVTSAP